MRAAVPSRTYGLNTTRHARQRSHAIFGGANDGSANENWPTAAEQVARKSTAVIGEPLSGELRPTGVLS